MLHHNAKCQFIHTLPSAQAVSDTGVIRSEAEINYYVSQVEVISYIESMLLGDPFNFLSNWPTFVWLRRFPSCRYIGYAMQECNP